MRREEQKNDQLLDFAWFRQEILSTVKAGVLHMEKQSFRCSDNLDFTCRIQVAAKLRVMVPQSWILVEFRYFSPFWIYILVLYMIIAIVTPLGLCKQNDYAMSE